MTAPEYTRITHRINMRLYKIDSTFPAEPWFDDPFLRCWWDSVPVGTLLRLKKVRTYADKPGHYVLVFARDDVDDGRVYQIPLTWLTTEHFRPFENEQSLPPSRVEAP